jgi:hypothetical protein
MALAFMTEMLYSSILVDFALPLCPKRKTDLIWEEMVVSSPTMPGEISFDFFFPEL